MLDTPLAMSRLSIGKTFALAAVGILLGAAPSIAKESVKIGLAYPWAGYGFWYLAKEKNLAPDLDIEITIMSDPLQSQALLAAGAIDVVDSTVDYAPVAAENKLPLKIVASHTASYGADKILIRPGVDIPAGIIGQKVAVQEGFIGQIMMGMWLEKNGVGVDKVKWVSIGPEQTVAPMITGDIKVGYLFEPWSSQLLKQLEGSSVVYSTLDPDLQKAAIVADAMYMSDKFLSQRREIAVKAMKAYWDGVAYWRKNPAEANAIMAKALQFTLADVTGTIGSTGSGTDGPLHVDTFSYAATYCGQADGEMPAGQKKGQIFDSLKTINDWWIKLGVMKTKVDIAAHVDCGLFGELIKAGYGDPAK
ncbi:ABC transporter substrate-binding protein [Hyphomicrobium sp.]|uniref:ABC transporter substrate-binding protein n=1 Tax=Hyphomicrobium sp. TaxID=82 RepID=UPI001E01D659|nr:ABC transporter substrate-binding protein [Hyphomicrobium sp.]MBY0558779.1 ABC transporter substrate-binding protein [Hyphomicrobium sp.]